MSSLRKGKTAEAVVLSYLLRNNYNVYIPFIDTGIDFIVETPKEHRIIGIQVKSSRYQPSSRWWGWNISRMDGERSKSVFYVLYFDQLEELPTNFRSDIKDGMLCFVIPFDELDRLIRQRNSKTWNNKGEFPLSINKQSLETGRSKWLQDLKQYLNNWDILM